MLKWHVTDGEMRRLLGESAIRERILGTHGLLQDGTPGGSEQKDKDNALLELLPKALAEKFRGVLPAGFVIKEIELAVQISGSPFGCGVNGEARVVFGADPSDAE